MSDGEILEISVDGSSRSKPRRGGIGFRFNFPESCNEKPGKFSPPGYLGATNNQMELSACISAIKMARRFLKKNKCFKKIIIYTDSKYVSENYRKAMFAWSQNKWLTSGGAPVANYKLWKELMSNMRNICMIVEIKRIKGHSGDEGNEIADKLAKKSAERAINSPIIPVISRRKLSPHSVDIGSVKVLGQKVLIRIVTSLGITSQKDYKYKYEVISKRNRFYQCVDIIYSAQILRPAHKYLVKMNKNQDYPQITKVIKESLGVHK